MKPMVVTGMVLGTVAVLLLIQIDKTSTYGDFLPTLMLLGFAVGLSVSPATDTIMDSFPENELGVGGGANDTALELGGSLGIAILGSLLGTIYKDKLTDLVGGHLPAAALDTAKDSVGGGLAVAQEIAKTPSAGPQQAQALVDAVHEACAHGVAQTASLVGGIIMAAGTHDRPRGPARPPRGREQEAEGGGDQPRRGARRLRLNSGAVRAPSCSGARTIAVTRNERTGAHSGPPGHRA
ncbi:hypothetical protein ACRAWF_40000 [Streptomyces sp. L7]